jgi:hypothetical protein
MDIFANLRRVVAETFGNAIVPAQVRDLRDPVKACGYLSVVG